LIILLQHLYHTGIWTTISENRERSRLILLSTFKMVIQVKWWSGTFWFPNPPDCYCGSIYTWYNELLKRMHTWSGMTTNYLSNNELLT